MTKNLLLTDEEFILLLKQQNDTAFSYLYDKYSPLVYGIVLKATKDENVAAEILKLTFVKIFKECKEIDCLKQRLFSWILSLARKTAFDSFNINIDPRVLYPSLKQELQTQQGKTDYLKELNTSSSYFRYNSTN